MDVIESIAKACDLNWQELEDRLKSNHYRDEVMSQYVEGWQIGFQGIPGFVIGNAGFTGAAPYDVFRSAAQRAMTLMSGATASEGEG
jgi:predicted DsbA family dithiol-disulfide isomerase